RDGKVWDALAGRAAGALLANLETNGLGTPAAGIWEVHEGGEKQYANTTLAAARGFCDMAGLSKLGNKGQEKKYQDLEKKVREAFLATFVDPQGALAGNLEELGTN